MGVDILINSQSVGWAGHFNWVKCHEVGKATACNEWEPQSNPLSTVREIRYGSDSLRFQKKLETQDLVKNFFTFTADSES